LTKPLLFVKPVIVIEISKTLAEEQDPGRSKLVRSGFVPIGLGIGSALLALLAWIPPEIEQARAGDERDLGVGLIAVGFSVPISFFFRLFRWLC
jgi:hypothetical protein